MSCIKGYRVKARITGIKERPTILHELTNPFPLSFGPSVAFHAVTFSANSCPNPAVWFNSIPTVISVLVVRYFAAPASSTPSKIRSGVASCGRLSDAGVSSVRDVESMSCRIAT